MLAMVVLAVTVSIADILSRHQTEPLVDRRLQPTVDEWRLDMHRAGISYEKGYNRINIIRVRAGDGLHSGGSDRWSGEVSVFLSQLEAGPYSVKGTLYHELGHQVFRLDHGSCALMRQHVWTEAEYRENWAEWTKEYLECIKRKSNY
jgi:hypothetical protein